MLTYRCFCCGALMEEDDLIYVDFGIGKFEYWGATYNDVRMELASPCCHAAYEELDDDEEE
jgi:hypothetical protein